MNVSCVFVRVCACASDDLDVCADVVGAVVRGVIVVGVVNNACTMGLAVFCQGIGLFAGCIHIFFAAS